ncbi:MAG: hypothetical protein HGA45_17790 [Chloroflexales bacterium]|nr:hypothetical protein [Chloroflexales bacterium]
MVTRRIALRSLLLALLLTVALGVPANALSQSNPTTLDVTVLPPSYPIPAGSAQKLYYQVFRNGVVFQRSAPATDVSTSAAPYRFKVTLNSAEVRAGGSFEIRVRIADSGLFVKADGKQAFTPPANGGTLPVTVQLGPGSGKLPGDGSGSGLLAIGIALAALAGALLLWRQRRLRLPTRQPV